MMNRRRYESILRVLGLLEEQRDSVESTPLGAQLMTELRDEATTVARLFKTQSNGRNSAHDATRKRRTGARLVRKLARALARHAKALAPTSGLAIELPPLREGSHQQLIADAQATLDAVQQLSNTFKDNKLSGPGDLAKQIADLEAAMKAQSTGIETHVGASVSVNQALRECARLATALEPFFLAAVNGNVEMIARWKNANRVGPARPGTDDATAPATAPVPAKPATDKIA